MSQYKNFSNEAGVILDVQQLLKKVFEDFKKEQMAETDRYFEYYEINNPKAIENNVKDGWGLMDSLTPSEYIEPMDFEPSKKDAHFQNVFEKDRLLDVEYEKIILYMGDGWEKSLREGLVLIKENKYQTIIPFFVSILEKCMNKILNHDKNHFGENLRLKFGDKIQELPEGEFVTLNAIQILSIFNKYIFKNGVNSHSEVPIFNRNLIQHGNDIPDRWTKIDVYKLISLIAGLIMVDNELNK